MTTTKTLDETRSLAKKKVIKAKKGEKSEAAPKITIAAIGMCPLNEIETDTRIHFGTVSKETVNRYAEAMRRGDSFPPVLLIRDSKKPHLYKIIDGHHRVRAAIQAGEKEIKNVCVNGSIESEGVWLAASANEKNGRKRSNTEKRIAACAVLSSPYSKVSDRVIAKEVGLSNTFIGEVRKRLEAGESTDDIVHAPKKEKPVLIQATAYNDTDNEIDVLRTAVALFKSLKDAEKKVWKEKEFGLFYVVDMLYNIVIGARDDIFKHYDMRYADSEFEPILAKIKADLEAF